MKKNYLLPFRVSLLWCLFFSSDFLSGQNVTQAKISLQSSKIRSPLPNKNYSASPERYRKDLSLKDTNKIDTASSKLKVASPNFQQAKELPKNAMSSVSAEKVKTPVPIEKAQLAPFGDYLLLQPFPKKETAVKPHWDVQIYTARIRATDDSYSRLKKDMANDAKKIDTIGIAQTKNARALILTNPQDTIIDRVKSQRKEAPQTTAE